MVRKESLFSDYILNIFTDASMIKINDRVHGCSGAICVLGDKILESKTEIIMDTTNNFCELYAIAMGIDLALKYRQLYNLKFINLFSDSKISVYGLREWIFGWLNNIRFNPQLKIEELYTSSGNRVANQELFICIINTIINNNLMINLYHQNGHINCNNKKSLEKATSTFVDGNFISSPIDINLIIQISYYNDIIDNLTRDILKSNINQLNQKTKLMINPLYQKFDTDLYKTLINI